MGITTGFADVEGGFARYSQHGWGLGTAQPGFERIK
jgi:hypothetical protein